MDTKEVSDSKKIRRQPAVTNLHSPQPPLNELKNGDEDEGYSSKPPSRPPSWAMSPSPSQTSLHSTPSTANIPSTIPENDEDLEAISFGCADHKAPKVMNSPSGHSVQSSCAKKDSIESTTTNILILPDSHHKGGRSPSEGLEDLYSKLALLKFTGSSAHQSFQKCSLCNSQLKPRKLSYQHPPLHSRVDYRRGSEATVSAKPEKEPTCIMCRRNSQKTSPPPKRKLSKGYIFKATPMRRWNSQIITVSLKNKWICLHMHTYTHTYTQAQAHTHTYKHTHTHHMHACTMNEYHLPDKKGRPTYMFYKTHLLSACM